jgi:hypothetical protein
LTSGVLGICKSHWTDFGLLALCGVFTLVLGATAVRLSSAGRRRSLRARLDETGGLSEELVLVFPFFLFFLAMTVQMLLLLNARLVVNYAAFVAGRSASVWIPSETLRERPNSIQTIAKSSHDTPEDPSQTPSGQGLLDSQVGSETEKFDRIQGAAALACAPISPNYFAFLAEVVPLSAPAYRAAANAANGLLNGVSGAPRDILTLIPQWIYSHDRTYVFFQDMADAQMLRFQPKEDIKVTVHHDFHVSVPWVGSALALGRLAQPYYPALSWLPTLGLLNARVYYVPIEESYVFRNEGERLAPGIE